MKPANGNGANLPLKITMVLLLLFFFFGILFSVIHGMELVGYSGQAVADYYRGNEEHLIYPKEKSQLMESTHVHIFVIPLIFYFFCHLFVQTALTTKWKIAVISFTFVNITGFLIAPYIIRYLSPAYAFMLPLHHVLFIITAAILTVYPLWETFRR